jgi:hypothetical protein
MFEIARGSSLKLGAATFFEPHYGRPTFLPELRHLR